ncbi:MAG: hypothetical protein NVSMB65_14710 [Chloroflexota bacterium]
MAGGSRVCPLALPDQGPPLLIKHGSLVLDSLDGCPSGDAAEPVKLDVPVLNLV